MVITPRWQQLNHPVLKKYDHQLWVCQLHSSHPGISGNKVLKLKYQLQAALQQKKAGLLTMGGAFSNHLLATAASCAEIGLTSIGLVRTDKIDNNNPTLQASAELGMRFIAVDRENYRQRSNATWLAHWQQLYPDFLLVPEGGTSELAVQAVSEFSFEQTPAGPADWIVCAVGSGGTVAGLIRGAKQARVLGIQVVKDSSLIEKVRTLSNVSHNHWQLQLARYLPQYGKVDLQLWNFCCQFQQQNIDFEPVYTGKALFSLLQTIDQGELGYGKRICFFHTGGQQGLAGLRYRALIPLADPGQ